MMKLLLLLEIVIIVILLINNINCSYLYGDDDDGQGGFPRLYKVDLNQSPPKVINAQVISQGQYDYIGGCGDYVNGFGYMYMAHSDVIFNGHIVTWLLSNLTVKSTQTSGIPSPIVGTFICDVNTTNVIIPLITTTFTNIGVLVMNPSTGDTTGDTNQYISKVPLLPIIGSLAYDSNNHTLYMPSIILNENDDLSVTSSYDLYLLVAYIATKSDTKWHEIKTSTSNYGLYFGKSVYCKKDHALYGLGASIPWTNGGKNFIDNDVSGSVLRFDLTTHQWSRKGHFSLNNLMFYDIDAKWDSDDNSCNRMINIVSTENQQNTIATWSIDGDMKVYPLIEKWNGAGPISWMTVSN